MCDAPIHSLRRVTAAFARAPAPQFGQVAAGWDSEALNVENLLREIIVTQSHQIQQMQMWLDTHHPQAPKYCDADGVLDAQVVKSP